MTTGGAAVVQQARRRLSRHGASALGALLVPAVLFPAEQRDEVLDAIARQVAAMQSALAAMPDLAASLRTLGGEST